MKKQVMYHSTNKKNKKNILENGLVVNNSGGFTIGGSWAHTVYGGNPIFLSDEKERYSEEGFITFAVDVTGLNLLADLPTLIDFGANLEEDYTMWWGYGESPKNFEMFLDDGAISAYDIIGNDDFNKTAIKVTRTAAVMENIPAERVVLLEDTKNEKLARLIKNIRKNSSTYYGKAGAGILFVCKEDQTCLLLKRSNRVEEGGTWGISGGAVSKGEGYYNKDDIKEDETLDFKETAFRESNEELFSDGSFNVDLIEKELIGQTEFKDGGFKYLTFVYNVSLEAKKQITSKISLDWENDAAKWFSLSSLPSNLHFGVDFTKKSLIEQDIGLFRSTYDEFDWLYEELTKIKDNSKNPVWKDIFEKFYLLPRKTPGINLYDLREEQDKKTYKFILESSKKLNSSDERRKARDLFHLSSKILLNQENNKTLEKIPKKDLSAHDGFFYHGTNFQNAISILRSGRFVPLGVFTRLCLSPYLPLTGKFGDVVFVFDAKKLQRKGAKKMNYGTTEQLVALNKIDKNIDENWIKNPWISDVYKPEKEWVIKLPFDFSKDDLIKVIIFKDHRDNNSQLFFDYIVEKNNELGGVDVEIKDYPSIGKRSPAISKRVVDESFERDSIFKKNIGESLISIKKAVKLHQEISKKNLKKEWEDSIDYVNNNDEVRKTLIRLDYKIYDLSSAVKKINIFESFHEMESVSEKLEEINNILKFFEEIEENKKSYPLERIGYFYGENWFELFSPVINIITNLNITDNNNIPINKNISTSKDIVYKANMDKSLKEISNNTKIENVIGFAGDKGYGKSLKRSLVKQWCADNFDIFNDMASLSSEIREYMDGKEKYKHVDVDELINSLGYKINDLIKDAHPSKVKDEVYAKNLYYFVDSKFLNEISEERLSRIVDINSSLSDKRDITANDLMNYRYPYADSSKKEIILSIAKKLAEKNSEKINFEDFGIE